MIDPGKILRTWLLGSTGVTALLGTNADGSVYVGDIPPKADPALGAFIQLMIDGGLPGSEIVVEADVRVMVKVWVQERKQQAAMRVYRAVYDVLHGQNMVDFGDDGRILVSQAVSFPQITADPDSGWVAAQGWFQFKMIATTPGVVPDFVPDNDEWAIDGGQY